MKMEAKKIVLVCGVCGCYNRESYTFTKNGEFGRSAVMCPECLKEAYELVFPTKKAEKAAEEPIRKIEEKAEPIKREPAHRTTATRSKGR